jgi:Flp pilus assembly protein TadG
MPTLQKWSKKLRKFQKNEDGTIIVLFGLTIIMLFMVAGCGLDFARGRHAATKAGAAIDGATLAAAKAMREDPNLSDAQLLIVAQQYFDANIVRAGVGGTSWGPVAFAPAPNRNTGTVQANVAGTVATYFYRIAGPRYQQLPVTKSSAVTFNLVDVEIGLVLDVTGSMNANNKLNDMKDAVKLLADILLPTSGPKNVKIGLAPYSAAANLGPYASIASGGKSKDGCVVERLSAVNRYTDAAPTAGVFAVKGELLTNTLPYVCPPSKLAPMTDDHDTIVNTVNSYAAGGCTAGHIGITWGWNLISPNWSSVWPKAPAPYNDGKTVKAVIVMTDGSFNTAFVNGGANCPKKGDPLAAAEANKMCDAIKAQGVQIYTIGLRLNGEDDPAFAKGTLAACASSVKHALLAENGDELKNAFKEIAVQLNNIRLTQ